MKWANLFFFTLKSVYGKYRSGKRLCGHSTERFARESVSLTCFHLGLSIWPVIFLFLMKVLNVWCMIVKQRLKKLRVNIRNNLILDKKKTETYIYWFWSMHLASGVWNVIPSSLNEQKRFIKALWPRVKGFLLVDLIHTWRGFLHFLLFNQLIRC